MRRGLVHALAWLLATGAAVALSWWGVRTVMSGTVYDRPSALPLTGAAPEPWAPATWQPQDSPSPSAPEVAPATRPDPASPAASPAPPDRSRTSAPPPPSAAPTAGSVRSYAVDGGRVAFDLGETSAELVSATPASGWQMQVWKQERWIRVTFTRDGREVSVFCVWHDSAPRVEVDDRRT
ncbi:hypothetical protein RND61_03815 [Streptomyces sp. TRM76323]|uniref:Secreted protein n=1 Tax=Streptomyces tamarix TaxID=3078565 RepID=A0ABU3QEW2_9ACTN|nr:hypothetical protein [Streptomyces tamarix]MDT9681206.1 hypothetical protein [Streptomyces tamarix]